MIFCNISIIKEDNEKFKKDVKIEIECKDKTRCIIVKKLMYCLFRIFKKYDEVNKNKHPCPQENKYKKEISTAKI